MAQLRCFGCDRNFSPRGLSQHYSKTQDPRCRRRSIAPQFSSVSATIPWAAFSLGTPGAQEGLIGPPEPVDAMDADVFDSGTGHDDETGAQSDGESTATFLGDNCESSPDNGLGI